MEGLAIIGKSHEYIFGYNCLQFLKFTVILGFSRNDNIPLVLRVSHVIERLENVGSLRIQIAVEVDEAKEAAKFTSIARPLQMKNCLHLLGIWFQTLRSNYVPQPFHFLDTK